MSDIEIDYRFRGYAGTGQGVVATVPILDEGQPVVLLRVEPGSEEGDAEFVVTCDANFTADEARDFLLDVVKAFDEYAQKQAAEETATVRAALQQ